MRFYNIGDATATSIRLGSPEPLLVKSGKESLIWTFAIGGGKAGAYVGSIGGPLGTTVDGLIGSGVGGTAGATIANKNYWEFREDFYDSLPVDAPEKDFFFGRPGGARP